MVTATNDMSTHPPLGCIHHMSQLRLNPYRPARRTAVCRTIKVATLCEPFASPYTSYIFDIDQKREDEKCDTMASPTVHEKRVALALPCASIAICASVVYDTS